MNGPTESLGGLFRRARTRAGLSQAEVARRSGLSVRALRDIEQERVRQPHPGSLERLSEVLGIGEIPHRPPVAVQVLGALRLFRDSAEVTVRGAVPRAVLALIALRLGQPVPREEIRDALWGDRPPASWVSQVHAAVGRVRTLLEPARERGGRAHLLRLEPGGYALRLEPSAVDVHSFSAGLAGARARLDGLYREGMARDATLRDVLAGLDTALRLWRGAVLDGEPPGVRDHAVALAASGQRLEAVALLADVALELGRPDLAIEHLRPATQAEPYHEGLHARLVLALAARGEQSAALDVVAAVRARLVDDLGVEPGPELRRAQALVLRGERPARLGASSARVDQGSAAHPVGWTVPRLLPADLPDFTGRDADLRRVGSLLDAPNPGTSVSGPRPVVAVAGMAGVGKTALVVRAAHHLADDYPDGQLYVNLRGADAAPLTPAEVLARFLRATGVEAPAIPQDAASREDLYRTRTAGRRLLVVLDNAASAAQVRPLLPAGPDCAVLVSARTRLPALEGARWMDLGVLPPSAAVALFGGVAGAERIADDPLSVAEITDLCGYLPLAVRIAGARLAARPGWPPSRLAELLRDERYRLDQLAVGDLAVRTSMELSYRELGPGAARVFRLLGLLDAPDLPGRVAAAVLGVPLRDAAAPLAELVDSNLLVETGPDVAGQLRYRFHDLVRLYARERAAAEETADAAGAAVRRALGAWLALADRFARAAPGPCYAPLPGTSQRPDPGDLAAYERLDPLDWFEAEQLAVRAGVTQACREGLDELAFELAASLEKYFDLRGMYEEWRATNEQVMRVCQERGNLLGEAVMLRGLVDVRTWNTEYDQETAMGRSLADSRRLRAMFERLDEPLGRSDAEVYCAWGHCAAGDNAAALACAERALELATTTGHLGGQARAEVALAVVKSFTPGGAGMVDHLDRALAAARELGNPRYEASVLQFLGIAYRESGDVGRSDRCLRASLDISRKLGDRYTEVLTLLSLARLHLLTGDPRASAEAALSLVLGRQFTMPHHVADALMVLGDLALADGDPALAVMRLTESVALWRTRGWPRYLAEALVRSGVAHRAAGDPGTAQRCWTEAAGLFTSLGDLDRADRARDLIRAGRGSSAVEAAPNGDVSP